MKNYVYILITSLCFLSCSKKTSYIEQALVLAKENRVELEKVLNHYKNNPADSLKYSAAVFLIENMPGHHSYKNTALLSKYYDAIDKALISCKNLDTLQTVTLLNSVSSQFSNRKIEQIQDIHIMKADFLIQDIERSFDIWENSEWSTHLKFEDFCEYILPYKVTELQPLDDWKHYMKDIHRGNIDTLHFCSLYENSAFFACREVNQQLKDTLKPKIVLDGRDNSLPIVNPRSVLNITMGRCDDYSIIALLVMRSKGIPVTTENTPQWPFRSQGHSWNTVFHNTGKNIVFAGAISNPDEPHKMEHKMAKAFRKTYAINRDILKLISTEKIVPPYFRDYFKKDVTDEYMKTEDLNIPLTVKNPGCKYAYLAVFNNKEWIPIQYGEIKGNHVKFTKMGRDVVYLPVYYKENRVIPAAEPFLLTKRGNIKVWNADTLHTETIVVKRKYPYFERAYNVRNKTMGGQIQASHHEDFRNHITLHTIHEVGVQSGEILIDSLSNRYRYWRYYPPDNAYCNIADLYFYTSESKEPITGKIIGSDGSLSNEDAHIRIEVVFDNDPLTYFNASIPSGAWVGLDFGEPVAIDKIQYVPRGDGNCITYDHKYELRYWKDHTWVSTEVVTAKDIKLIYQNIPSNTLYWLRNLTTGTEERIFTYENGKQIWW